MLTGKGKLISIASLLMLAMAIPVWSQASSYPNVPPALAREVDREVDDILMRGNADRLGLQIIIIVSYTVADAVTAQEIRKMEPYEYYGDLRRTDQQVGASSTSSGSTSAVEKPGLIELIGLAIERGAIQQSVNDSTVTLTTSPYALVAAVKGDSPETYQNNPLLTRLGVSATFILNDPRGALASLSRKQLTEWSAKFRLTGDRSTRSKAFRVFWNETLGGIEQMRLNTLAELETALVNNPAIANLIIANRDLNVVAPLIADINKYLTDNSITATPNPRTVADTHRQALREKILSVLFKKVYEPVKSGTITVDSAAITREVKRLVELQKMITDARKTFQDKVKAWATKGTVSTFAYTNHRVADGSDYSEFKLLFERKVNNLEAVLNAGLSIYNKPDPSRNQERLRDFSISGSLEWASKSNPLFRGDEELATPITLSFSGRYERLKENENMTMREPDIGNFQARLEIPIAAGFSIPIAYTYATATEMMPKPENRFNVGLHVDVNKIISFKKALKAQ
jgi:hypothetical protein